MATGGSYNPSTFSQKTPFETWAQVQGIGLYWDTENQFAAGKQGVSRARFGGPGATEGTLRRASGSDVNVLGGYGQRQINVGGRDYGSQALDRGELDRIGTIAVPMQNRLISDWRKRQKQTQKYLSSKSKASPSGGTTNQTGGTGTTPTTPTAQPGTAQPGTRATRRAKTSPASSTMPVSPGQAQPAQAQPAQGPVPTSQGPTSKWPNPTDPVAAANRGLVDWRAKQVPPSSRFPNPIDPIDAANKGLSEWSETQRQPPMSSFPNPSDPVEAINKNIGDMLRSQQRALRPEEASPRFVTNKELFDVNRSLTNRRQRQEATSEEVDSPTQPGSSETPSAPTTRRPSGLGPAGKAIFAGLRGENAPAPTSAVGDQNARLAAEGAVQPPQKRKK
jgi:hypothetical protein